jgi:hypothetical protein
MLLWITVLPPKSIVIFEFPAIREDIPAAKMTPSVFITASLSRKCSRLHLQTGLF